MIEAFKGCTVSHGKVTFTKNYSPSELRDICDKFTIDLLSNNIPHYRVVGFIYPTTFNNDKISNFSNYAGFNQSLIELSYRFRFVIPDRIGGNDISMGCFYAQSDSTDGIDTSKDSPFDIFKKSFGEKASAEILTKTCSNVGQLIIAKQHWGESIDEIRSDNMWFCNYKNGNEDAERPQYLIRNKVISQYRESEFNVGGQRSTDPVIALYMKGTGKRSFSDNQGLVLSRYKSFFPCSTKYNLSEFILCSEDVSDGCLHLTYREDIDESVITKILNEYGG